MTTPSPRLHFELRPLAATDLPSAHALSLAVGWPHRLEDWSLVLDLGEGIAATAADGSLVGTAMWWRYDGEARIGMVVVSPAVQRAGLGRRLMDAALAQVGAGRVVLVATADGLGLYERLGFVATGAIHQYQGTARELPAYDGSPRAHARPMAAGELERVVALDAEAIGAVRREVITAIARAGEIVVLEQHGAVAGFAACREFGRGALIGPLVARDLTSATHLVTHLVDARSGSFVRVDIPMSSGLADLVARLGLIRVDEVTTMARGAPHAAGSGECRTFALANQALG